MRKFFILVLGLLINLHIHAKPVAIRGFLDLSKYSVNDKTVFVLDGEWEFYWKQLLISEPPLEPLPIVVEVPSIWNGYIVEQKVLGGSGYATYHLKLILPKGTEQYAIFVQEFACAYKLYVDGKLILSNGKLGPQEENYQPQFKTEIGYFQTTNPHVEIFVEVANYSHSKGGFWESIRIGSVKAIHNYKEARVGFDFFLTGSLLIMGIYHFGLYSLRRKDKASLYLGIFCFLMILRVLTTGDRLLFSNFHSFLSWEVGMKLEYLTFYLATPIFATFLYSLYPEEFQKKAINIIWYISLPFVLFVIFTKTKLFSLTAIPFQIFTLSALFYTIYALILAITHSKQGSFVALVGFIVLFGTILNDILYNNGVINTAQLAPFGLFGFIFSQAFLLSVRFSRDFFSIENLTENLTKTTQSYSRFIPKEFLGYLEESESSSSKPKKEISILFCEIRSMNTNEDQLHSEVNILFIDEFIRHINPIIRQQKGFIDRYVGDAIMAIFPVLADHAVVAAIEIAKYLEEYNRKQKAKNSPILKLGIGIHTESLPTTQDEERNEGTFLSNATDLAVRIEGFTKIYGSQILASEQTIVHLAHAENYYFRFLGRVNVKGKVEPAPIFEIYNLDSPEIIEKKNSTKLEFEKAVLEYYRGNKDKAFQTFQKIFQNNKYDLAAYYFLQKCKLSQSFTEGNT